MLPASDAKPILDILARIIADQAKTPEWRDTVIEAQLLFERRVIFLNDTKERTAHRILILLIIMSMALISFILLLSKNRELLANLYDETLAKSEMTTSMLIGTAILGCLGACLSALLSFTTLGRAPGVYESAWVTIARPVVGAVTGVIAIMFVRASLVDFKNTAAIGLVAFLFGFSERLIIGAVQRVEVAQKN